MTASMFYLYIKFLLNRVRNQGKVMKKLCHCCYQKVLVGQEAIQAQQKVQENPVTAAPIPQSPQLVMVYLILHMMIKNEGFLPRCAKIVSRKLFLDYSKRQKHDLAY